MIWSKRPNSTICRHVSQIHIARVDCNVSSSAANRGLRIITLNQLNRLGTATYFSIEVKGNVPAINSSEVFAFISYHEPGNLPNVDSNGEVDCKSRVPFNKLLLLSVTSLKLSSGAMSALHISLVELPLAFLGGEDLFEVFKAVNNTSTNIC